MEVLFTSDVLQSTASTGRPKYWSIAVRQDSDGVFLQTESWHETADGSPSKRVRSVPRYVSVKNQGRSNETTLQQQGINEAESEIAGKRDKGYSEIGTVADILVAPMLAHQYEDRKHTVQYPVAVQRKLNGCRYLFDGKRGWSRGGKLFDQQIANLFKMNTQGFTLDGELLLNESEHSFESTVSAIKKFKPLSKELQYHVYDVIAPDLPFCERLGLLADILQNAPTNVHFVPTWILHDETQVMEQHGRHLADKAEGSMIRSLAAKYTVGQRSVGLLKLKPLQTDEFLIVDISQGVGRDAGAAIFVCQTPAGVRFNARPAMTIARRQEIWNDRQSYIGKFATVQYQVLTTEDKVPLFPVGLEFSPDR